MNHAAHRGGTTISQIPNLILEYVLGDDNLADIFSQPPFVRVPTVAGLGVTVRPPQEAPSLRHKTASPATSVNVVSTHAQQHQKAAMAPVVTRCGSAGCQHAATGKTCEEGGSCTASSTSAGRGRVAGSTSRTAEGQGRDVAGVTATRGGASTTAHAEEQDDASDAEKHTTFSLQRTAIQLSRNSSAIYTRKTSCDATVRIHHWKQRPLHRPGQPSIDLGRAQACYAT